MRFLKQFLAVVLVSAAGSQAVFAVQDNPWLTLVAGVLTAVLALLTYAWVVRRTEHRAPDEVARAGAVRRLAGGVLLGLVMFSAVMVNIAFLGGVHYGGIASVTGAVGILGFMVGAAVTEELIFRGVLFRIVEERIGTWLALLLTGVAFGLSHLANEDATWWGVVAIAVEAGFMLAACYAAFRNLWVPIGLHLGWNFALGGIFGVVVSGNGDSEGLLDVTLSGSEWVTGGAFGPEGSLYTVGAGILLTAVFLAIAARRGRLVPLRRRAADETATVTVPR